MRIANAYEVMAGSSVDGNFPAFTTVHQALTALQADGKIIAFSDLCCAVCMISHFLLVNADSSM